MKVLSPLSYFCLFVLLALTTSCKQNTDKQAQAKTSVDDSYEGVITGQDMRSSPNTAEWFKTGYENYHPDAEAMKTIKNNINDYKIVVFMGTWCPDSHRDIPHLYKILEQSDFNTADLKVYALNASKKSEENYEKGYDIINVPTLIFYKNGEEVNRYVENSRESLAKDIAKIVSGGLYKNLYAQ